MIRNIVIALTFIVFSPNLMAIPKVAKAIIVKGKVLVKNPETKKTNSLKKGEWVLEKSIVQTQKKGFAKLRFIDGSQVNVAPNSRMIISKFPKNKAGILSVIKGQIRTKVSKNLLNKNDSSKLYIKTKSAAMGVRGTDFQVSYSEKTGNTAVVTFEGIVSMAQIEPREFARPISYQNLENKVNGDQSVQIKEGQFAASSKQAGRVNIPVKISTKQFAQLKKNETMESVPKKQEKKFQSPIPPGVPPKEFINTSDNVDKQLEASMGPNIAKEVVETVNKELEVNALGDERRPIPPPEGAVYNDGSFAPTSGGAIDFSNAQYIPPPPGSTYNPDTRTYEIPNPEQVVDQAKRGATKVIDMFESAQLGSIGKMELPPPPPPPEMRILEDPTLMKTMKPELEQNFGIKTSDDGKISFTDTLAPPPQEIKRMIQEVGISPTEDQLKIMVQEGVISRDEAQQIYADTIATDPNVAEDFKMQDLSEEPLPPSSDDNFQDPYRDDAVFDQYEDQLHYDYNNTAPDILQNRQFIDINIKVTDPGP